MADEMNIRFSSTAVDKFSKVMGEGDEKIHVEYIDEGLSAAEVPNIRALWELKKRGGK